MTLVETSRRLRGQVLTTAALFILAPTAYFASVFPGAPMYRAGCLSNQQLAALEETVYVPLVWLNNSGWPGVHLYFQAIAWVAGS